MEDVQKQLGVKPEVRHKRSQHLFGVSLVVKPFSSHDVVHETAFEDDVQFLVSPRVLNEVFQPEALEKEVKSQQRRLEVFSVRELILRGWLIDHVDNKVPLVS